MAYTTLSFPFGSTLSSTKVNQLQNNITAVCSQDGYSSPFQPASFVSTPDNFGTIKLRSVRKSTGTVYLTASTYYWPTGGVYSFAGGASRVITLVGTTGFIVANYPASVIGGGYSGLYQSFGANSHGWNEY